MPLLPPVPPPVPEFVTLPQALRWIVNDEMPVPVDYLTGDDLLPYFSENERDPRQDLFHHMLNGTMRLWGSFCKNVRVIDAELGRRRINYGDIVPEKSKIISIDDLILAKYESISWRYSRLEFRIPSDELQDSYLLWVGLRIASADLFKVAPPSNESDRIPDGQLHSVVSQTGALHASSLHSMQENKVAQDVSDPPPPGREEYTTKLLKAVDELRDMLEHDEAPEQWTRPMFEAECHRRFPDFSQRDINSVASVLLSDSVRSRGRSKF